MTSSTSIAPFRFDARAALRPISADEPAGESLRYDPIQHLIGALRPEDDPDAGSDDGAEPRDADWPGLAETCLEALETKSKDLQIAAWLLEAWVHLHGFAGLREGLRLIAGLCETFWDDLYPQVLDGDLEARVAPFQWIDETLPLAVKQLPITQPDAGGRRGCSLAEWEQACAVQGRQRRRDAGAVKQEQFIESLSLTPTAWLAGTAAEVTGALAAAEDLRTALEAQCDGNAPSLPALRETLRSISGVLSTALNGREQAPASEGPAPAVAVAAPAVEAVIDAPANEAVAAEPASEAEIGETAMLEPKGEDLAVADGAGSRRTATAPRRVPESSNDAAPIRTRGEAYQRLAEAADFIERSEPHSPVPHLIRRAIKWGSLSFDELLPELLQDSKLREDISRSLRADKPQQE